jgi:hypothetical protein
MAHGDIQRAGFANFKEIYEVGIVSHDAEPITLKGNDHNITVPKMHIVKIFECQMCGNSVTDIFKHELFFHR